jgi:hypothetical protein
VEKYGTARQATDDNIIYCMCFTYWITKAKNTHSEYAMFIAVPQQCWWMQLNVHCLVLLI